MFSIKPDIFQRQIEEAAHRHGLTGTEFWAFLVAEQARIQPAGGADDEHDGFLERAAKRIVLRPELVDLKREIEQLRGERDDALSKLGKLERQSVVDTIAGKRLGSYQRLILGVAMAKYRYPGNKSAVTNMVDDLPAPLALDPKTVRKILSDAAQRFGTHHRSSDD